MADWSLAIDFGTTFTAAATAAAGASPEPLEIDGSRSLPSVVCLDDDRQILTGRTAASQAAVFPERAERLPKRALAAADTVRLDGQDVPTVQLVAAVLGRVAREATRRFNGEPPTTVVLTHPAGWGPREITRLGQAAAHAGLPAPRFLPEPVAAAIYYTAAATETGVPLDGHAAVYDLGGGTFDTAVLRRTADGYDVRGTGGDPHFGGEDIDTLLLDLVAGHLPADARDTWDDLWGGDARRARRAQTKIREEIVKAKHELSERPTHTVYLDEYLDGVDDGIRLTRAELDEALTKPLAGTTTELLRTIRAADLDPAALTAVYLTGGATRTPRITDAVTTALGTLPTTSGDPKLVVALGALTTPPAVRPPTQPAGPPALRKFTGAISGYQLVRVLNGHTGEVSSCVFSPDGRLLASASQDCTIRLWDVESGSAVATLPAHMSGATACAFSPDGQLLATVGNDNLARLWEVSSRTERAVLSGHTRNVRACEFSPDGKLLATTSDDRSIRMWDVGTGHPVGTLTGHTKKVTNCSFSPDGSILATAGGDRTVRLWDTVTGRDISVLHHSEFAISCTFSPDGSLLATSSGEKLVRLWDVATGQIVAKLKSSQSWGYEINAWVYDCAFSPDGQLLVTGNGEGVARLWNVASRHAVATLTGHTKAIAGCAISSSTGFLATASVDCTVRLWEPT